MWLGLSGVGRPGGGGGGGVGGGGVGEEGGGGVVEAGGQRGRREKNVQIVQINVSYFFESNFQTVSDIWARNHSV